MRALAPLALALIGATMARAQGTKADYARAAEMAGKVRNTVFRGSVAPHWIGTGPRFWYRNALPGGKSEWVLVDPAARKPAARFDDEQAFRKALGEGVGETSLKSLPGPRPSGDAGPETSITFVNRTKDTVTTYWLNGAERVRYATIAAGQEFNQHTLANHTWLVEGPGSRVLGVFRATEAPARAVVDGAPLPIDPPAPQPGLSPDGSLRAFVRGANVFVVPTSGGEPIALTADGRPGDEYEAGALFWSPDSKRLVALRTEAGAGRKIFLVASSPRDQLQPKLSTPTYDKPGDKIPHPRIVLLDVPGRRTIPVDDILFPNPYLLAQLGPSPWDQGVTWAPDSAHFYFVYDQRGNQIVRVISVDAATGAAKAIVDERVKTFFDYQGKLFSQLLPESGELLWMSERDGWNHLYRIDARTGAVKNQITRGPWVVKGIEQVDPKAQQVLLRAGGIVPGQDPYQTHFVRVGFDGKGLTTLTEGDGEHRATFSPDGAYFVDTYSRTDLPPVTELRRTKDGKKLATLETADVSALTATGWRLPEPFVAKGRDGATDIFGVIWRPTNFDPAKKWPVIEQIYAGPQGYFVPKGFSAGFGNPQQLAELGFVVVQIDGMGTSGRSKAFHDVCWKNLKDAGFPDRIAWLKAAAAKYPYLDLSRVGIYGGSAGGQNALAALLWHGDFYKAAVADCGCHDNRIDKLWWNELWMGWPVDDSYADSSNVVHAGQLQGKLLLVVGEVDSNVDPASTLQVVDALIRADKDFELLVVPGSNHGAAESPYGRRRRMDFFVRSLLGVEPRR